MSKKSVLALAAATLVAAGSMIATAPSAEAATPRNGVCEAGEVCFYYNSNYAGSVSDFTTSVANYGTDLATCYVFKGAGAGNGLCIKNNVASVRNLSKSPVTVYYNSNYGGASQTIAAGASANLNATLKNNNASHLLGSVSTAFASPAPSTARVTANYPNYPSGGYHPGIDIAGFTTVTSACTGTVDQIRIDPKYPNSNARGISGTTNYVWVNCGNGIRMGYAHFYANKLPSHIKVGAAVKAGQALFPVGNQGNSTGAHLHYEVRQNGTVINPFGFLRSKGVTGLPS